jgi:hypothetical protein
VNPSEIARQRLANQRLTGQPFAKPVDVVAALGAVQAQDYPGAKWAIAQRTRAATDAVVEQAVNDGSIIRTHVLRPTWHFVMPADLRWMLALTAKRINTVMGYYNHVLGLDEDVFRRAGRALRRALSGGKHLTRVELARVLERAGVPVAGEQRLGRVLVRAEQDAIICSGARRGKQFTYALLDERVPSAAAIERDESLARLIKTYFATRGPATARDFAWWAGLTVTDAKRGIELAGSELAYESVAREKYWFARSMKSVASTSPIAHLLPNYDEYFIGFRDRSAIAQRLQKGGVETTISGLIANTVTIDGQVVGGWKRTLTGEVVLVELTLLTSLTSAERKAINAAVQRYEAHLGLPVKLSA